MGAIHVPHESPHMSHIWVTPIAEYMQPKHGTFSRELNICISIYLGYTNRCYTTCIKKSHVPFVYGKDRAMITVSHPHDSDGGKQTSINESVSRNCSEK